MMYRISKLAREIAEYLDVKKTVVWDILDEMGFQAQELDRKEVMRWTTNVSKRIFNK